jgi:hypothetical protein
MVTARNGIVAGVVVIALLAVWFFRFGGTQVPGHDTGHGDHGTPAGWRFIGLGDPARGRDIFAKYEASATTRFGPFASPRRGQCRAGAGGDGTRAQAGYFVEAIVNPSAVIDRDRGYEAADGSSKMPSYNDSLTVQELIDLVAYLKALRPPPAPLGAVGGQGGHAIH